MSERVISLMLLLLAGVVPLTWLYRRQAAKRGSMRLVVIWMGIIAAA